VPGIGSNHFPDQLEELTGEEIMWEGDASLLGAVIQLKGTEHYSDF